MEILFSASFLLSLKFPPVIRIDPIIFLNYTRFLSFQTRFEFVSTNREDIDSLYTFYENINMPCREPVLVNNEYYHVFNRGVNKRPLYTNRWEYLRMVSIINYYRYKNPPVRYSFYSISPPPIKNEIENKLLVSEKLVDIVSWVLMPNHFHFLLKQNSENGITEFIHKISVSYSHFFNKKYSRIGPLMQGPFRSVLIESDEQLLHVSRYIHLNPYTSFLIKTIDEIFCYEWSSMHEYLNHQVNAISDPKIIISMCGLIEDYKKFVVDQSDYQRKIHDSTHDLLDFPGL